MFAASGGMPAAAFAGIEDPLAPKVPPGPVDVWNSSVWTIASLILFLVAAVAIAWICWWGVRARRGATMK